MYILYFLEDIDILGAPSVIFFLFILCFLATFLKYLPLLTYIHTRKECEAQNMYRKECSVSQKRIQIQAITCFIIKRKTNESL